LPAVSIERHWDNGSNMDELGHADWPDAHPDAVYVPIEFEADLVPIPVSWTGKRITLIGCFCADATFLKPVLIIPRHYVDAALKLFGISQANCDILHQTNGLIGHEIFEHWVMEMFVSEMTKQREKTRYECPHCWFLRDVGCMMGTRSEIYALKTPLSLISSLLTHQIESSLIICASSVWHNA
jgi:hypothetical protein